MNTKMETVSFNLYEKLHKFEKEKVVKEIKDTEEEIASETV